MFNNNNRAATARVRVSRNEWTIYAMEVTPNGDVPVTYDFDVVRVARGVVEVIDGDDAVVATYRTVAEAEMGIRAEMAKIINQ